MRQASLLDRSTTEWLLICLGLAVLPHVWHVALWTIALAVACGIWRWFATRKNWRSPSRIVQLTLAVAGFAAVYGSYGRINGHDSGVALLVTMVALKLLETRSHRDAMLLLFLSYFLLAANFLFSQSIPMTLYAIPTLVVISTALVLVNQPAGAIPTRAGLRQAGRMLIQALPVMLVLFVLFPRLSGPLWGLPNTGSNATTGLSDNLSPGNISQLSLSDAVAFRVRFNGAAPSPSQRYWRGPILWDFNGQSWTTGSSNDSTSKIDIRPEKGAISYEVTLEPHGEKWLLALDVPMATSLSNVTFSDRHMLAKDPILDRLQYHVTSYTQYRLEPELPPDRRQSALALPLKGNSRARRLVSDWRSEGLDNIQIIERSLAMFRNKAFFYTLNPPPLDSDSVDDFLFNTRRGFCEHYASAFTFLMRAAGIPARVVVGYQGGELNPLGDYYIVRQSDAHAWSEVWIENRGWIRIDPTAAVSPARIEQGMDSVYANEGPLTLRALRQNATLLQVRLAWDAANHRWNEWVLAYGPERQKRALEKLGMRDASPSRMVLTLTILCTVLLSGLGLFLVHRARPVASDPLAREFDRFCRRMARSGLVRKPSEGPMDFAQRAAATRPDLAEAIWHITRLYIQLRYTGGENTDGVSALRRRIRRLHPVRSYWQTKIKAVSHPLAPSR